MFYFFEEPEPQISVSKEDRVIQKVNILKGKDSRNMFSQKCIELDLLSPTKSSEPGLPAARV